MKSEVLNHFEQLSGVWVEGNQDQLVYRRGWKRIAPEQVRAFMKEGFRVFSTIRSADKQAT